MGMTLTQKILAAHAGLESVNPGQLIRAKLDIVLGNDITTPVAINEFTKNGFDSVFDKDKIAIVLDHFVPNKDIKAAQLDGIIAKLRELRSLIESRDSAAMKSFIDSVRENIR